MNIIISNKSSIAQQAKINEYRFQDMSILKAIDVANRHFYSICRSVKKK